MEVVNHPEHYNQHPSGIECITIVEEFCFNIGNAIKYLWRAGLKGDILVNLRKAKWYIHREFERIDNLGSLAPKNVLLQHPSGIASVTITEAFSFNVGNAIEYLWNAGLKGASLEDLRKADWHVQREIDRVVHPIASASTKTPTEEIYTVVIPAPTEKEIAESQTIAKIDISVVRPPLFVFLRSVDFGLYEWAGGYPAISYTVSFDDSSLYPSDGVLYRIFDDAPDTAVLYDHRFPELAVPERVRMRGVDIERIQKWQLEHHP